ncbi:dipeptide epimerase [Patescibacteria group bacterium]|nr:dipeptide epimerase [Candidatus Falkowbacteria bacterium]MBU3906494.1 dipeptide epimerase [Patescibacteria group bacterium]MCG2697859.1 dipeptide epimerase [Candidatus Parcubacteria bacterium]MBU4015611.1 dipeptide epimerase [Patescibacteria group bacterium]MBU4026967.1 dipeptide epimerase [Patescibacteria group bacterium]
MISKIFINKETLHFRAPFKIAYEEVTETEIIIIQLIDSQGNIGLGSASPDTEVTGETLDKVSQILNEKLTNNFFANNFNSWYEYHKKIQHVFAGFPSAQAAIEEAYLNLWSQLHKIPLSCFFGGYRKSCNTMVTIGIQPLKQTLQEVKKRLSEDFQVIKLKCGLNIEDDLKKIQQVLKILPSNVKLALDANQGYSLSGAKKMVKELKETSIAFFEQPVKAKNWEELKILHQESPIPIIADESVITFEDAFTLLSQNYVSGVNIKLMKCGGPINFIKIFRLTKKLGKKIMIGCMYESNISITMGVNLALGLHIDYIDLDSGHLDFYDDPTQGGAEIKNGKVILGLPLKKINKLN